MPSDRHLGGRIATGIGTLVVAGAVIVLGSLLPTPVPTAAAGPEITPEAYDQQRVCTGPIIEAGSDATSLTANGAPVVTAGTIGGGAGSTALANPDVVAPGGAAPTVLAAPATTDPAGLLAAASSESIADADTAGLVAEGCAEAASSSWLVAGATDTGRTSLLLLSNPGGVAAEARLAVYTADGPVQAPGLSGISIPAFGQRALSLAAFAPGAAQLAVQVTTTGGTIVASLQHAVVRGLEPGGIELVGATATPAPRQTVPGVRITTAAAAEARAHVGGSQDVQTVVRVLAPEASSELTIGITPEGVEGSGITMTAEAKAGEVLDVPVEGLADGTYTVTVEAETPIVAAVRVSTVAPPDPDAELSDEEESDGETEGYPGGDGIGYDIVGGETDVSVVAGERIDLAWFVAATDVAKATAFATAAGPAPRLSVVSRSDAEVTVEVDGAAGRQTVTLPPNGAASLDLAASAVHVLSATGSIAASISYVGDGVIAAYPVRPANPFASPLTVYR